MANSKAGYLLKVTHNRFYQVDPETAAIFLAELDEATVFDPQEAKEMIKRSLLAGWHKRIEVVVPVVSAGGHVVAKGEEIPINEIIEINL